jgi:ABC-type polar amino acid transport system ATPase subunit
MTDHQEEAIEAIDLFKNHGAVAVLRGACLRVFRGEVAAIVGPSGSGKSTFLRCLNGLETFQGGRVRFGSLCIRAEDAPEVRDRSIRDVRRRVGMVFQAFHLFPHLDVLRNVTEAPIRVLRRPRQEAETRAIALLDRVGMSDKLHARVGQLSGGQQQRVAIARALAMDPEIILFDEPTSALDPRMTAEVLSVIADLARSGQTMVVVTHAMNFARRVADTVHVFGGGVVVESGSPGQVFDAPRTEIARKFLHETTVS